MTGCRPIRDSSIEIELKISIAIGIGIRPEITTRTGGSVCEPSVASVTRSFSVAGPGAIVSCLCPTAPSEPSRDTLVETLPRRPTAPSPRVCSCPHQDDQWPAHRSRPARCVPARGLFGGAGLLRPGGHSLHPHILGRRSALTAVPSGRSTPFSRFPVSRRPSVAFRATTRGSRRDLCLSVSSSLREQHRLRS